MRRDKLGFIIGAAAGGVLALVALLWPASSALAPDGPVVAQVNGHIIPRSDLDLALEAMARDSRNPLPEDARERALSRLVDEELLFQRGVELDLPRTASNVRRAIVMSMIDAAIQQADEQADEDELRNLFERERAMFMGEPRLRIRWLRADDEDDEPERPVAHPPDQLIRLSELRVYLGAELTQRLTDMSVGEQQGPIDVNGRANWIEVLERREPEEITFDSVRPRVEALWRERAQEGALEDYLVWLRARADIDMQGAQ